MNEFQPVAPSVETTPCLPNRSSADSFDAPYGAKSDRNLDPTGATYGWLIVLYTYFNRELFDDQLPNCLISLQRKRGARGYFAARRFAANNDGAVCDEIALNPRHWGPPFTENDSISTLVHEQVHLWQAHFGKPGRGGYHNREFARKMIEIGLVPSSNGQPGGLPTGRRISHYIREDGPFDRACRALLSCGFQIPYHEMRNRREEAFVDRRARSRTESKTTYTCPNCSPPVHVWGRPRLKIICGACDSSLVAEGSDHETKWFERSQQK